MKHTQKGSSTSLKALDQNAEWKNYASTQYKFSFQYPSAINVSLITHAKTQGTDLILPGNNFIEKDGSVGSIMRFWVFQKLTVDLEQYITNDVTKAQQMNNEFLDGNGNPPVKLTKTAMTVGGNPAWLVRYEYYPANDTQKPLNRIICTKLH